MKQILLVTALVSAGSVPALAADLVMEPPIEMASPAYDWSGFYLGAHAGLGLVVAEAADPTGDFFEEDPGDTYSVDAQSFLVGLQAGMNWQMDNFVLGVEGDVGYFPASGDHYTFTSPDNFGTIELGAYGDLAVRAGVAVNDILFYLKGGLAVAQIDVAFGDLDGPDPDPNSNDSFSGVQFGWTIGAGAELAIDERWSAKAEYRYFDFGTVELADTDGDPAHVTITAHTVTVGLNYGF